MSEKCDCPVPGVGKEYRCDDEKQSPFPSHCPCVCHRVSTAAPIRTDTNMLETVNWIEKPSTEKSAKRQE